MDFDFILNLQKYCIEDCQIYALIFIAYIHPKKIKIFDHGQEMTHTKEFLCPCYVVENDFACGISLVKKNFPTKC